MVDIKRIVTIIAVMYGKRAEVVVETPIDEYQNRIGDSICFLFLGLGHKRLKLSYEEKNCLEYNEIIELDSGCFQETYESEAYHLTDMAYERIVAILKDNKALLLKE